MVKASATEPAEAASAASRESLRAHRRAELVILLTLFGVGKHIIGICCLDEFFFSLFLFGIRF